MEVKLTDAGLKLLGFGPDRIITNVHIDRAYTLMVKNYANKDRNFMALYEANHPKPEPMKVSAMKKPKRKPREKAVSRKAIKREKAVIE